MTSGNWRPQIGEWVEVRPVDEILATLDERGELARLPFMPEMLKFAGHRFQVSASAHKTCDTVNYTGNRRIRSAVHLADLRCDGSSHGQCQAECLLFWKTAWLKPATGPASPPVAPPAAPAPASVRLTSHCSMTKEDGVTVYRCQATTLPDWSEPMRWWAPGQYVQDIVSGNVTIGRALRTIVLAGIFNLRHLPFAYRFNCWLYAKAHQLLHGRPDPVARGCIPREQQTPDVRMDLAIGEPVRIRSLEEINATLNTGNRNRGLHIDSEMTRFCGKHTRVTNRVSRIINENTGEMMHFKNPCIVLEGTECLGDYSDKRLLCPRRIKTYWREAWVERLDAPNE